MSKKFADTATKTTVNIYVGPHPLTHRSYNYNFLQKSQLFLVAVLFMRCDIFICLWTINTKKSGLINHRIRVRSIFHNVCFFQPLLEIAQTPSPTTLFHPKWDNQVVGGTVLGLLNSCFFDRPCCTAKQKDTCSVLGSIRPPVCLTSHGWRRVSTTLRCLPVCL